ncbi:MAG: hypothetical protein ACXVQ7_06500, partial [Actinomycetota bacterium]
MGASEEQRVVQTSVDRFDVDTAADERREVWVARRDRTDILGSIETARAIGVGGIEANDHGLAPIVFGQEIFAVPAVPSALVLRAVDLYPLQLDEMQFAAFIELPEAYRACPRIETDSALAINGRD